MEKLRNIVADVLCIDIDRVDENLTRDNCEEWDSFNHLLIVSEIESRLNVKLTMEEMESASSYRALEQIVMRKAE
ncbi:acyl carrier protein [Clostridium tyrobutyricum]|uniref:acyl carrier protein n=1 Tax=Clostridium tyrobutyricum TaxID=1519 RepID=UPI001C37F4CC|nr:acyl carrier protein [Clostridium tyrobutyricum]MBV4437207.1 acyl carrier protein [Clostridium tyrobutyricum]